MAVRGLIWKPKVRVRNILWIGLTAKRWRPTLLFNLVFRPTELSLSDRQWFRYGYHYNALVTPILVGDFQLCLCISSFCFFLVRYVPTVVAGLGKWQPNLAEEGEISLAFWTCYESSFLNFVEPWEVLPFALPGSSSVVSMFLWANVCAAQSYDSLVCGPLVELKGAKSQHQKIHVVRFSGCVILEMSGLW